MANKDSGKSGRSGIGSVRKIQEEWNLAGSHVLPEPRESNKGTSKDSNQGTLSAGWVGFTAVFMSIFALVAYSKTQNEAILIFAGFVILIAVGLPPLMDFLKAAAVKGIDKEDKESANWKKSMGSH